ncbi:hypothetical protein, partial [Aliarcobacter butzleri]|uniref:hypothetical protein n=1 Tax=Aliarcobacter butzleri TaxID=28197 RepID=UPI003AF8F9F5
MEGSPAYAGREGAGAELMEIATGVDQPASQSSVQLRVEKLGISDRKFGSLSVDATGVRTMTGGGVQYADGQVSIA